ncbi:hypothetical protein FT663_01571 [Candidozyma haemuli var. vulneris]|uniref:Uncharacterized protein n=1 Tax=Candidozyma haemuli TaxID=45357 RepID=A0A2V1ARD9_9ASCO|nr:hypothetical protein CXQ85_002091 [[Candida] haemuloni]KAF3986830.1 hypothetical protein FT662_04352 [[Candida] haemuloni var. vulneris]KAF3994340.1 hypothetical protein FT663_01571 [[Candida] haemuloni var. vulneris]PVH20304.1 hypothetical protein CXQ85_002091 [[Candida] haemuloni]
MNCDTDHSFDLSNILDEEDLQVNDFNDISLNASPIKKPSKISHNGSPIKSAASLNMNSFPDLRISPNELFQVTHHLRSHERIDEPERALKNDKIEKLLNELEDENGDFELDHQLRTRVFRARLKKQPVADTLDMKLDSFLQDRPMESLPNKRSSKRSNDENKENSTPSRHSKKPRLSDRPRKSLSSIPSLQPLNNVTESNTRNLVRSPQRICVPKNSTPRRPCFKKSQRSPVQIYMVESSTGLVNDATQFGTELNASNCEGFLMPDNVNEIVQIPTNEVGPQAKKKLAIIKAHHSKRFSQGNLEGSLSVGDESSSGFYSKQEFDDYRALRPQSQVQVHRDTKAVRWADELEW